MSSWWDRHLGGGTGYTPTRESYPPTSQPQPVETYDPNDPNERIRRQGYNKKVPGSKAAVGTCPGCGGSSFFTRRWAGKECAPLCVDCGYNGDFFVQSGTLLNGVGFHSGGPVQFARGGGEQAVLDWSNPIRM